MIVAGAGAKFNGSKDHLDDIPADSLRFQYGGGCGFVSVHVSREQYQPSVMEVSFWDDQANNIYTFTKPNPRTAYVPPAPQAPPVPPRFAVYETESNKIAVCIAAVGLAIGGFIIWGGLSKAVLAGATGSGGGGGAGGGVGGALSAAKSAMRSATPTQERGALAPPTATPAPFWPASFRRAVARSRCR